MAATDTRTGFRLPWSSDQPPADQLDGDGGDLAGRPGPAHSPSRSSERPRRPTKFLADLTRAMQVAAEAAREETLTRLQTDSKAWVEEIRERSSGEAADLRRRADDDVAAVREWSKAEIARIREETEGRIAARKRLLEREVEEHAVLIERRVERVHARVAAFEQQMAAFFERLLGEQDPARFAALAENLPEPPPFDEDELSGWPTEPAERVEPAREESAIEVGPEVAADLGAAEAEAVVAAVAEDEIPTIADEALAARLAGLVTAETADAAPASERSTDVVVTGLVSVASIAGFKRQLARLTGVHGVAVSSGPNGEFVFAVRHDGRADLRAAVSELPGFRASVTGGSDRAIEVTASDPDSEA